jgi:hypothetical protein
LDRILGHTVRLPPGWRPVRAIFCDISGVMPGFAPVSTGLSGVSSGRPVKCYYACVMGSERKLRAWMWLELMRAGELGAIWWPG